MRIFLLTVLCIATLWDIFTTYYGTTQIIGTGPVQTAAAVLFSALIMAFVLNTARIMKLSGSFVGAITKFFWLIALAYDFYTSWFGNSTLLTRQQGTTPEIIIVIGLTILVTASPIVLSTLWRSEPLRKTQEQPSS